MPTNNAMIMLGLGAAALWFLGNRGGSEDDQVDQLTGASMMAAGEGTAPNAPFMPFSMPSDPLFFFNAGGEMARTEYSEVPAEARSGEDIGKHIVEDNAEELIITVERESDETAVGTSDTSLINPQFAGGWTEAVVPSALWDNPIKIAEANKMPLLAIQDAGSWEIGTGGINILGASVDVSNLSSKEGFRAVQVDASGGPSKGAITGGFTTDADTLAQYVKGFIDTPYNPQLFNQPARQSANDPSSVDEDRGLYPTTTWTESESSTFGYLYQPGELEFEVALTGVPAGTSDTSPATPEFASSFTLGSFFGTEEEDFKPTDTGSYSSSNIGVNTITTTVGSFPTFNLIADVSPTGQTDWWNEG